MPTTTATQWVYRFGGGVAEGDRSARNLLGGKGANLAEMASIGRVIDRAAARLRPLGCARLDAGHDGHCTQPRPQR
jgi:hypothetical protein